MGPLIVGESDDMSDWLNIEQANKLLAEKSPEEILQWAFDLNKKVMLSTTFGPFTSVLIHMTTRIKPDVPVVWVDSGYNTNNTYITAEKLIQDYDLNMHIYTPELTTARRDALMNGIPSPDDDMHEEFTRQVKLEPFQRAFAEIKPDIWLNGMRKEETEFRKSLDIVTIAANGVVKVAPLFNWTELDLEEYLYERELPQVEDYFDPTKAFDNRECGLHTKI